MRDVIHITQFLPRLWFALSTVSLRDGVVQNIVIVSINVDLVSGGVFHPMNHRCTAIVCVPIILWCDAIVGILTIRFINPVNTV